MSGSVYDVTFKGEAGPAIRAQFEDLEIRSKDGLSVVRVVASDQASLYGVINKVNALGLELLDVNRVEEGSKPSGGNAP